MRSSDGTLDGDDGEGGPTDEYASVSVTHSFARPASLARKIHRASPVSCPHHSLAFAKLAAPSSNYFHSDSQRPKFSPPLTRRLIDCSNSEIDSRQCNSTLHSTV